MLINFGINSPVLTDDSKINSLLRPPIQSWIRNGLSGTERSLRWSGHINRIKSNIREDKVTHSDGSYGDRADCSYVKRNPASGHRPWDRHEDFSIHNLDHPRVERPLALRWNIHWPARCPPLPISQSVSSPASSSEYFSFRYLSIHVVVDVHVWKEKQPWKNEILFLIRFNEYFVCQRHCTKPI